MSQTIYDVGGVQYPRPFRIHRLRQFGFIFGSRPHRRAPEGHCLKLCYYMEQVGWDGQPRPQAWRRRVANPWPESLEHRHSHIQPRMKQANGNG